MRSGSTLADLSMPAPGRHHDIHFTLDEARRLLPEIRTKVEAIMQAARAARKGPAAPHAHAMNGNGSNGNGNGRHADLVKTLQTLAQELAEQGIFLKDPDRGLIDFPHIRANGEEVYLCWLAGEKKLLYWHRIEDGFAGRQPIEDL